jgi:Domain of unknown function (DUF5122) beta-propeller
VKTRSADTLTDAPGPPASPASRPDCRNAPRGEVFEDTTTGVALIPDGKIAVSGNTVGAKLNRDRMLERYDTDGTLDTRSGTGGTVTTDLGDGDDFAETLIVGAHGRIILVGRATSPTILDMALVRYNPNGSPATGSPTPRSAPASFSAHVRSSGTCTTSSPSSGSRRAASWRARSRPPTPKSSSRDGRVGWLGGRNVHGEVMLQVVRLASAMRASRVCSNARHARVSGDRCAISSGRDGSTSLRAGLRMRV